MSLNSYSQKMGVEYYIKANSTIAFSKSCFNMALQTVMDGDRQAYQQLSKNGCITVFGASTKGKVHVYLFKREGVGYAKYRIKGKTDDFVWLSDESVVTVK